MKLTLIHNNDARESLTRYKIMQRDIFSITQYVTFALGALIFCVFEIFVHIKQ